MESWKHVLAGTIFVVGNKARYRRCGETFWSTFIWRANKIWWRDTGQCQQHKETNEKPERKWVQQWIHSGIILFLITCCTMYLKVTLEAEKQNEIISY